jgi:hypothetical protein
LGNTRTWRSANILPQHEYQPTNYPQVINPQSALLSKFEVLALLHDLEHDHLERTTTALRVKKEEDIPGNPNTLLSSAGKDENLRTVEVEVWNLRILRS